VICGGRAIAGASQAGRLGDEGVSRDVNYEAGEGEDGIRFASGATDCIADHLSLSWTIGKIVTIREMSDRITIQWSILSESLNFAGHKLRVAGLWQPRELAPQSAGS
jgi:hypothetical protein